MSDPKWGSNRPFLFDVSNLAAFWRRLHPHNTARNVHVETGFPVDTVKNWLKGRNGMTAEHVLIVLTVYGPAGVAAMFSGPVPAWIDEAHHAQAKAERKAQIAALNIEIATLEERRSERRSERRRAS